MVERPSPRAGSGSPGLPSGAAAVTLLLACLLGAACGPLLGLRADRDDALAGTSWTLQALGEEPTPPRPAVTLLFEPEGRISGNDGCNRYQGDYRTDGRALELGRQLAGTLMACPDPVEAQARTYREALQRAAHFELDDRQLDLHDGTGRLLARFVRAAESPVGLHWDVLAYGDGRQGVVRRMAGTRLTAEFGHDGQVSGHAGCNAYFARYELEGAGLRVGPAATTRSFCADPAGVMEQEAAYLAALQSAATFALEGDRLELRTADGALAVSLQRHAGE